MNRDLRFLGIFRVVEFRVDVLPNTEGMATVFGLKTWKMSREELGIDLENWNMISCISFLDRDLN